MTAAVSFRGCRTVVSRICHAIYAVWYVGGGGRRHTVPLADRPTIPRLLASTVLICNCPWLCPSSSFRFLDCFLCSSAKSIVRSRGRRDVLKHSLPIPEYQGFNICSGRSWFLETGVGTVPLRKQWQTIECNHCLVNYRWLSIGHPLLLIWYGGSSRWTDYFSTYAYKFNIYNIT